MEEINDGGAAFPLSRNSIQADTEGMSLRDYFAGQALVGMLARIDLHDYRDTVQHAYNYADIMLIERTKNDP